MWSRRGRVIPYRNLLIHSLDMMLTGSSSHCCCRTHSMDMVLTGEFVLLLLSWLPCFFASPSAICGLLDRLALFLWQLEICHQNGDVEVPSALCHSQFGCTSFCKCFLHAQNQIFQGKSLLSMLECAVPSRIHCEYMSKVSCATPTVYDGHGLS